MVTGCTALSNATAPTQNNVLNKNTESIRSILITMAPIQPLPPQRSPNAIFAVIKGRSGLSASDPKRRAVSVSTAISGGSVEYALGFVEEHVRQRRLSVQALKTEEDLAPNSPRMRRRCQPENRAAAGAGRLTRPISAASSSPVKRASRVHRQTRLGIGAVFTVECVQNRFGPCCTAHARRTELKNHAALVGARANASAERGSIQVAMEVKDDGGVRITAIATSCERVKNAFGPSAVGLRRQLEDDSAICATSAE